MKTGFYVGVSPEATEKVKELILAILSTTNGDAVKIAALDAIGKTLNMNNISISNCYADVGHTNDEENE